MADEQPNIVPPDTSLVVAWAGEEVSTDAAERWAASEIGSVAPAIQPPSDTVFSWRCEPR